MFEKAIKSQPPRRMQQQISKFVNGWWNTRVQCQKSSGTSSYAHSASYAENLQSMFRITTQEHRETLKSTVNSITPDTITNMLTSILQQLSTAEPDNTPTLVIANTLPTEVQRLLKKASREQSRIGWALMLRGYLSQEWTVAYSALSGNDMKSGTSTFGWSKQVINSLWTYAFNMWEHCRKLLVDDDEGLKFTKVDNAIRNLYAEKGIVLNVYKGLFALPLARVLAKTTSTKQSHLLGMQAAKLRWEESTDTTPLENVIINLTHRHAIQTKTMKRRKQEKAQCKKDEKRKAGERRQRKRNKT
jgi:hypothetical protein